MPVVNVREAKTDLSKLIEAAERGEEIVIARKGVAAVRLVPVQPQRPPREPGWLRGELVEVDPDWWKPNDELTDLFEIGDPDHPDTLSREFGPKR